MNHNKDYLICKICNTKHNKFAFNLHLIKSHKLNSYRDYYIISEFNGIPPKCACGLCEDIPFFDTRSKTFRDIAFGHDEFLFIEEAYVKKYGAPKCEECQNNVTFRRGVPNKYCSLSCSGKNTGFSLDKTQKKIKQVVQKRYGVDNINHVPSVRSKQYLNRKSLKGIKIPQERVDRMAESIKKRWEDPEYKEKTSAAIKKAVNKPEERKRRSDYAIEQMDKDLFYLDKRFGNFKSRLSKPHQRIREALQLEKLGFKSEQRIGRYTVDELNEDKKIIIEVYGDYFHANPKKFNPTDEVVIKKGTVLYTAQEKWDKDAQRLKKLENLGYTVIVIWQSDDLEPFKQLLQVMLFS